MQLIEQWLGVDFSQPVEFIIAFLLVMVLIALVTLVIRGIMLRGGDGFRGKNQRRQRLFVGEWVRVDEKRRLILVRRDDVEHLLLIGGNSDLVVEQDVSARKLQAAPVAVAAQAVEPDVYTPPEEPRIPTTDQGYRSPLRTEPAQPAIAADAGTGSPSPEPQLAEATTDTPKDDTDKAKADTPSVDVPEPDETEPKLTGLQAARARIAALRKKSAELSLAGATTGVAVTAAASDSDKAGDADVPQVAAVDLEESEQSDDDEAPAVLIESDAEVTDVDVGDIKAAEGGSAAVDGDETAASADENELAARLRDVLIKPA